jgi:hypothetical protein
MFLIDSEKNILAKITVSQIDGNLYIGTITDDYLPDNIRQTFLRYEEIINGQMFSLLDDIEMEISDFGFAVSQSDHLNPLKIFDLQMMNDGKISFSGQVGDKVRFRNETVGAHLPTLPGNAIYG